MSPRINPKKSQGFTVPSAEGLSSLCAPQGFGSSFSNLAASAFAEINAMTTIGYFRHIGIIDKLYESNNRPHLDNTPRTSLVSLVENLVDRYDIKAVFWDADGTLFHTEFAQFILFQLGLEKEGASFSIDDNQLRITSSDWKIDFIPDLSRKLSEAGSKLEVEELLKSVFVPISAMFEQYKETMLRPGVFETLTWLQNRGIPCGIATLSTREQLRERLLKSGIYQFFHTTLSVDELSKRKPDPESLIKLAEASGISADRFDQCLVIGDTQNDFAPAKLLGMRWICYDDTAKVEQDLRKKHHVHDPLQRYTNEMHDFSGLILPRKPEVERNSVQE